MATEDRKIALAAEVHWLENFVAKSVIAEKTAEIIGGLEKISELRGRVIFIGIDIVQPFTSLCMDIFARTDGQIDTGFLLNVLARWNDNVCMAGDDIKFSVFQKMIKRFKHFAKLLPNIGHALVQAQMFQIILDYVPHNSVHLKEMFKYVPNIEAQLNVFFEDEKQSDMNMKKLLMLINDAVNGQVVTFHAKGAVFRDHSLYAAANNLLWVDFNVQTASIMVTFDSASIDPKLFDGGKLVHASIGKEQIMSTTCKWNTAAETYAISLTLKFNSPPKMSDSKLQRKIWYVNEVELLLPWTESEEQSRLKCKRVQKLLRLWQNIPEPNVDDLNKQLEEDWQAWLDNPNLRTEWLAECEARKVENERKKAEQAKNGDEMDRFLASLQQQVQAADRSVIAERATIVIDGHNNEEDFDFDASEC